MSSQQRKAQRYKSKEQFPECEEASKRSLQCLMDNEGKRARCGAFFQAYQECNARAAQERKELEKMRDQVRVR